MAAFIWLMLGCVLPFLDSVQTLTADIHLAEFAYLEQNISLRCDARNYGANLASFEWFKQVVGGADSRIYYFDFPSKTGFPSTGYVYRTEVGHDDGNVTLTILNATMEIDDGIYYCVVQDIPAPPVASNNLNVTVYAEVTHYEFPEPAPDEAEFTCLAGPGRPPADIIWSKNEEDIEGDMEQVCSYDNYCTTNSTLHVVDTRQGDEIKCTATQGYPFNWIYSEVYTIQTGNRVEGGGDCCLEWWIGLLSVCSILAVWIAIIFVGLCLLYKKVTRLSFWLCIIISNTILVISGFCVVIPMYNEHENRCECCDCCECSELWLCPLIMSVVLIVFDVCIGVCICMNRPRRQEESMQIRDDNTLRLNYHHSTFALSYLSLLKDDTELAGCDISDKTWKSSNPLATCTRTPKGHEWIIEVTSAADAGLYTCIAYLRLCGRVSIASKPTEVTVKFNELKQEEHDTTTIDPPAIRSRSSPKVAPSPDYYTDEEYAMQPRLPTITPDKARELPMPQSAANVDIDDLHATSQQGRKKKKKRKKQREQYVDEPEPDYEYA